ncbi:unnamed protein product [Psylliodes chrysocephalus]|uniref:Uncharacterized protein n=1 Tax=Psylliodes chrysocephalus TaxID=3402493 RepID=A0A9P0CP40_9CUCU|nr:unnamed protein product [Psylliodes chrysocephala]
MSRKENREVYHSSSSGPATINAVNSHVQQKTSSSNKKHYVDKQGKNYKFYKYGILKSTDETCWCCVTKTGRAKLYTLGDEKNLIFLKKSGDHEHEMLDQVILNRQKVSNQVKRKTEDWMCDRPAKIIHREINSQKQCLNTLTSKDMKYIRNNFGRKKQERNLSLQNKSLSETNIVRVEDFNPLPSCSSITQSNKGRNSRQGSSYVITSIPYKDELEESLREQERRKALKGKGKKTTLNTTLKNNTKKVQKEVQKEIKKKPKPQSKKQCSESSSDSEDEPVLHDDSDLDADDGYVA